MYTNLLMQINHAPCLWSQYAYTIYTYSSTFLLQREQNQIRLKSTQRRERPNISPYVQLIYSNFFMSRN